MPKTDKTISFDDNAPLNRFFTHLAARGVSRRWAWEARRDGKPLSAKNPADIGMLFFTGNGFKPKHLTAIVVNYGDGGYGLFLNSPSSLISGDADEIAGPDADTPDQRAIGAAA